ncbi:MAG: response regulator [Pseudomonadales bacterium]|nr:response regulator [Pseudomonadales bacterium]MCP5356908.1 response regulator [Pseudomonadales bacterium]
MRELKRIAHVDDDDSIRAIVKIALERIGKFELLSCASGAEALDKVPGFAPDMILLDVMMPGMDGPATLLQLKQKMNLEGVAVVFMTAKVQTAEMEHYKKIGACNVIIKPFDAMQLSQQLRSYWTQFHDE